VRPGAVALILAATAATAATAAPAFAAHPLRFEDTGTQGAGRVEIENGLANVGWAPLPSAPGARSDLLRVSAAATRKISGNFTVCVDGGLDQDPGAAPPARLRPRRRDLDGAFGPGPGRRLPGERGCPARQQAVAGGNHVPVRALSAVNDRRRDDSSPCRHPPCLMRGDAVSGAGRAPRFQSMRSTTSVNGRATQGNTQPARFSSALSPGHSIS